MTMLSLIACLLSYTVCNFSRAEGGSVWRAWGRGGFVRPSALLVLDPPTPYYSRLPGPSIILTVLSLKTGLLKYTLDNLECEPKKYICFVIKVTSHIFLGLDYYRHLTILKCSSWAWNNFRTKHSISVIDFLISKWLPVQFEVVVLWNKVTKYLYLMNLYIVRFIRISKSMIS